jgi:hypothetical protein
MEKYTDEHGEEVHAKLTNYYFETLHFEQFGRDQEQYANWRYPENII